MIAQCNIDGGLSINSCILILFRNTGVIFQFITTTVDDLRERIPIYKVVINCNITSLIKLISPIVFTIYYLPYYCIPFTEIYIKISSCFVLAVEGCCRMSIYLCVNTLNKGIFL